MAFVADELGVDGRARSPQLHREISPLRDARVGRRGSRG